MHLYDYKLNSENTILPSTGGRIFIPKYSFHLSFSMLYVGIQSSLVSALVTCLADVIKCLQKAT